MAKNLEPTSSSSALSNVGAGPKLLGAGAGLFVLSRIIKWLPLNWVDGPILGLLWLGIIACVVAGAGLMYVNAKRS